jgi:BRCT domain type II-containing protein
MFFQARAAAAEKAMGSLRLELRKEAILRKKAYNQIREMKGNIRVLCRVRPAVVGNGRADEPAGLAVEVGSFLGADKEKITGRMMLITGKLKTNNQGKCFSLN